MELKHGNLFRKSIGVKANSSHPHSRLKGLSGGGGSLLDKAKATRDLEMPKS